MRLFFLILLLLVPGCSSTETESYKKGYATGVTEGYDLAVSDMVEKLQKNCLALNGTICCVFVDVD